jgi:rhodanese-related sulfurtransferase
MTAYRSAVLDTPAPEPGASRDFMRAKLAFHADCWDVAQDLEHGIADIVVIDARSPEAYAKAHIPGAINFPHRQMSTATTATLDRRKTYVVYCDGIGCNGSTRGAHKLAALGLQVKEMLGGLDYWIRDGHPVAHGTEATSSGEVLAAACACG